MKKNVLTINQNGIINFDENGFAKRDMTLQNPRCVINILKDHVSRYTPEMVERITGVKQKLFYKSVKKLVKPLHQIKP